jgi:puromycin-sensitive aminopeptidase
MFDVLTYQKGGSVLRMLEQYLGEETFRDGIRRYLTTHAYANTVTRDLWRALTEASGQPVDEIMDTWILQGGHPLVRVEDGSVTQTPFAYGPATADSSIGDGWKIPLLTRPLEGGESTALILEDGASIAPGTLVNAGGWGTYRTAYGPSELAAVAAKIRDLQPLERFTLIADTWAATQAGQLNVADFLPLAASLGDAVEPATWTVVAGSLSTLSRVVEDKDRPALAALARRLAQPLLDVLGFDAAPGEDEKAPTLRATTLSMLGVTGRDEAVRAEALRRFEADEMAGDIASAILGIVGSIGRPQDFDTMLERLRSATNPQVEDRYQIGMCTFEDPALSLKMFELCRTELRTQDAPYVVRTLLANRVAGPAVFEALCASWDEVMSRFPENAHSRMLSGVSTMISSRAVATEVAEFLGSHPLETGQRSVEQDLERLFVGVALGERERPALGATLRSLEVP